MASVVLLVELRVRDLEGFQEVAQRLIKISESEPGTLRYEWFASDDGAEVRVIEEFVDEAALATHVTNIENVVVELREAADIVRTGVLGDVSEERRERMAGSATTFVDYFAGFKR